MLSLRCSKSTEDRVVVEWTNHKTFGSLLCFGTWRRFMWLSVRGRRVKGKLLWPFWQQLYKFKTKDLGFNWGWSQNGPKFAELQKSSWITQFIGNVPVFIGAGVVHHQHFQILLEPQGECLSPPMFWNSVTQSGRRINIMCASLPLWIAKAEILLTHYLTERITRGFVREIGKKAWSLRGKRKTTMTSW